jgi:hypothetical protein
MILKHIKLINKIVFKKIIIIKFDVNVTGAECRNTTSRKKRLDVGVTEAIKVLGSNVMGFYSQGITHVTEARYSTLREYKLDIKAVQTRR